jgi:hypothetical protein
MSSIKQHLYEEEVSYEDSGMEEYELYLIFKKLHDRGINLEYFEPLMEEDK